MIHPVFLVFTHVFEFFCVTVIVFAKSVDDAKFFQDLELVSFKSFDLLHQWCNAVFYEMSTLMCAILLLNLDAVDDVFVIVGIPSDARVRQGAHKDVEYFGKLFLRVIVEEIQFICECFCHTTIVSNLVSVPIGLLAWSIST